jgi:glycosyltransferase 2 family protein
MPESVKEMPAVVSPPGRSPWLKRIFTWALAATALAFVARVVPFRDQCTAAGCEPGLWTTLRSATAPAVAGLFVAYLLGTLIWAARWRALLGVAGVDLPLLRVWRVTLEAQAGGILLPGGVGGDALRVAYVRNAAPGADLAKVIASILADRVVGLVTLSGLATVAALGFGVADLGQALPVLAAIPVAAVLGWLALRNPRVAGAAFFKQGLGARFAKPLLEYASAPGGPAALRRGLVLSLGVSTVQLLIVRGFVAALGAHPEREAWIFVGTTLSMMVGAVPALPGAWGTADAAYVFFLTRAGIASSVAAAACLLYRSFWYATGLIGALLALGRRSK